MLREEGSIDWPLGSERDIPSLSSVHLLGLLLGFVGAGAAVPVDDRGRLRPAWGNVSSSTSTPEPASVPRTKLQPRAGNAASCERIAEYVVSAGKLPGEDIEGIDIEDAGDCVKSIAIDKEDALATIQSIKIWLPMHSTLDILKNPPLPDMPRLDLVGDLDALADEVGRGAITSQYEFELELMRIATSAKDSHLSFEALLPRTLFQWKRSEASIMTPVSDDGKADPRLVLLDDLFSGVDAPTVVKINGKDARQFVLEESVDLRFGDNHTAYNTMFWQSGVYPNYFTLPSSYPGPTTTLEFSNGSSTTFNNLAVAEEPLNWFAVHLGANMYDVFVRRMSGAKSGRGLDPESSNTSELASNSNTAKGAGSAKAARADLNKPGKVRRDAGLQDHFKLPALDYEILIAEDDTLTGWLRIGSFEDYDEFTDMMRDFTKEMAEVEKLIIDVRGNQGGFADLAKLLYQTVFPASRPVTPFKQFRATDVENVLGQLWSDHWTDIEDRNLHDFRESTFVTLFFWEYLINAQTGHAFNSWAELWGPYPSTQASDPMSSIYFDLFDPLPPYIPSRPTNHFRPSDIVIVSDGFCSSACALFIELITTNAPSADGPNSGVKLLFLGGLPLALSNAPTTLTGANKGYGLSDVRDVSALTTVGFAAGWIDPALHSPQDMPRLPPIKMREMGFNSRNCIRRDSGNSGPAADSTQSILPTQFRFDASHCRVFYTREMHVDRYAYVSRIYEVAFTGPDGGMRSEMCV